MIDRILDMFTTVSNEPHGSIWIVLFIGFAFGVIVQYSRVDKFEKIAGRVHTMRERADINLVNQH